ncbi:sensor domain-containing diguanylate cyclase [Gilvimarinus chinensis]|uniref:sensor domain-containing diguanylate cyclase n=1 Tax=Gilvimarinus chinensis TaxID=396005 RepID=UPI0003615707|nr:diguanylate cyclase [Gilvimarinus chinensis]
MQLISITVGSGMPAVLLIFILSIWFSPVWAEPLALSQSSLSTPTDQSLWRSLPALTTEPTFAKLQSTITQAQPVDTTQGGKGAYGLRLELKSLHQAQATWFVNLKANYLDRGWGYWQSSSGRVLKLDNFGQLQNQSVRKLHQQAFPITLNANEAGVLWLYVEAKKFPTAIDVEVFSSNLFYKQLFWENTITLAAIAVMLTLALLALFVYVHTSNPVTLACSGYLGLHGFGWLAASGALDFSSLGTHVNPVYWGILIFPFAIAAACQFTKYLFNCSSNHPRLAMFFNVFSWVCLALGLAMPFVPFSLSFLISHVIALVWVPTSIATGISMLRHQDFRAKYYLVGNLFYGAALLLYVLLHVIKLPYLGAAEVFVVIALAIDCFCILLALLEWLKMQQQEFHRSYKMSRVDQLTQIGNRHAFNEHFDQLKKQPYCLVFIDFDGFKAINDQLGHSHGDRFLIRAAQAIKARIKHWGLVFRTGGDEFICLLPLRKKTDIATVTTEIKQLLSEVEIELAKTGWEDAALSFGIATSFESKNPSNCLSLADQRMYQHKRDKMTHHDLKR